MLKMYHNLFDNNKMDSCYGKLSVRYNNFIKSLFPSEKYLKYEVYFKHMILNGDNNFTEFKKSHDHVIILSQEEWLELAKEFYFIFNKWVKEFVLDSLLFKELLNTPKETPKDTEKSIPIVSEYMDAPISAHTPINSVSYNKISYNIVSYNSDSYSESASLSDYASVIKNDISKSELSDIKHNANSDKLSHSLDTINNLFSERFFESDTESSSSLSPFMNIHVTRPIKILDFKKHHVLMKYKDYLGFILPIFVSFSDKNKKENFEELQKYIRILSDFLQCKKNVNIKSLISLIEYTFGNTKMLNYKLSPESNIYKQFISFNKEMPTISICKNLHYITMSANTVNYYDLIHGKSAFYSNPNPYTIHNNILYNFHRDDLIKYNRKHKYYVRYSIFLGSGIIVIYPLNDEDYYLNSLTIINFLKKIIKEKLIDQVKHLANNKSDKKVSALDINNIILGEKENDFKKYKINGEMRELVRSHYFVLDSRACFKLSHRRNSFKFNINKLKFYEIACDKQDSEAVSRIIHLWYNSIYDKLFGD